MSFFFDIPTNFNEIKISHEHRLILKFSRSTATFTMLDMKSNTVFSCGLVDLYEFYNPESKLGFFLKKQGKNFGKVILLIDHPVFTLIPDELYDPENLKVYLSFTHSLNVNEKATSEPIAQIPAHLAYWIPFDIENLAEELFLIYEIKHFAGISMKSNLIKNTAKDVVYVYISKDQFLATVISNKSLMLCNTYYFNTTEDFIFFILAIYKETGFDLKKAALIVSGETKMIPELHKAASTYIATVELGIRTPIHQYSQEIEKLPVYFFDTIYESFTCV